MPQIQTDLAELLLKKMSVLCHTIGAAKLEIIQDRNGSLQVHNDLKIDPPKVQSSTCFVFVLRT